MTRRKHRQQKAKNLKLKEEQEFVSAHDRPEWADEQKATDNFEEWRVSFLRSYNPSYKMKMAS